MIRAILCAVVTAVTIVAGVLMLAWPWLAFSGTARIVAGVLWPAGLLGTIATLGYIDLMTAKKHHHQ